MRYLILALIAAIGILLWRVDSVTSQRDSLKGSLAGANATVESLNSAIIEQGLKIVELAKLDQLHTERLDHAQRENDRLSADVATGKRRLLIKANCPSSAKASSTTTASVDDAGAAELDPTIRQDYYALRRQVTRTESALAGLQGYVREVCVK